MVTVLRGGIRRRGTCPRAVAAAACVVVIALGGCAAEGDDGDRTAGEADTVTTAPPTADVGTDRAAADGGSASGAREPIEVDLLDDGACPGATADAEHPDVVAATLTPADEPGAWDVAVTLCSLYDTPERYADAWRVVTPDGDVLGTRQLLHDHAGEQPFTRSLVGSLTVPDDVATIVVEARDRANGWGGATLEVDLPG